MRDRTSVMATSRSGNALLLMVSMCNQALALEPDQIYARGSPSIVTVRALDAQERPLATGSGVVVAPGKVVTNCATLARAKILQVRHTNVILEARLEFLDVERDLCQLDVRNLGAPSAEIGSTQGLRVGQRVYAIAVDGRDIAITDGVISSFRDADSGARTMQITTRTFKGSGGGGLFDSDGRLIGVVASQLRKPQNFAVPADWISEVPSRAKEQLARYREASAAPADPKSAEKTLTAQELTELFRTRREIRMTVPSGLYKLIFRSNGNLSAEFTNLLREGSHRVSSDRLCLEFYDGRQMRSSQVLSSLNNCFAVTLISERKYRFTSSDKSFVMEGEI